MGLAGKKQFHAGEWVEVLAWGEIEKTLDADGTCDGLPFMPEMMEYCGGRFQVHRYAENVCAETSSGQFGERTFIKKDIVLLDGLRCSGQNHDGCERLCLLFWRESWLRKAVDGKAHAETNRLAHLPERHSLKTKESPTKYFCQATQLSQITRDREHRDTLSQCMTDLRTGAIGFFRMIGLIVMPFLRKKRNLYFGRPRLRGTLTRTPVEHLGLKPGDLVQVKSQKEMRATVDKEGRNRGLVCDIELKQYCGGQYRVQSRLDKIISEATGEMRKMDATVTLEGIPCLCSFVVGGCPRGDFSYFREIWLKKVSSPNDRAVTCVESERAIQV